MPVLVFKNKPSLMNFIFFFVAISICSLLPQSSIATIEVSYSHRIIPDGRTPDQELLNQEAGIWATFTGSIPMSPVTPDTSLHQVSDRVYRHFFSWDWSEPYETSFLSNDGETISVLASPEPVFPFDPTNHGVPVIHLHTPEQNLWDSETGIYVWGNNINFDQTGSEWERPATFDYHGADGSLLFSEPVGIRINGQFSRYRAQKGIRIYFDDYGSSDESNFNFFDSEPSSIRRMILRDNYLPNDWIYSNLAESVFRNLDHLGSRYSLIHAYLNNEYWGTYSLRDRIDDDFFEYSLGFGGSDFILLKGGAEEYGNSQLWYDFLDSFSESTTLNDHQWFVHINNQMDLTTYIDWLFINVFGATTDNGFKGNVMIFRLEGGKWTHLMWDEDLLFFQENLFSNHLRFYSAENEAEFNEFNPPRNHWVWSEENQAYCTMFNRLMHNSEFKALFSTRVDSLLTGPLSINGWTITLNELVATQSNEAQFHSDRWGWWSVNNYSQKVESLLTWIEQRHPFIVNQKSNFMEHYRTPVELVNFEIQKEGSSVHLSWQTDSEDNCAGFKLFRSTGTPNAMIEIASHETDTSLQGKGGIWTAANYEYIDTTPASNEINFYQLQFSDSTNGQDYFLEWIEEIWTSGWDGLTLNEIMAQNDTTNPDSAGEYDDWFEIVNNNNHHLPLYGIFFTDDSEEPTKFQYQGNIVLGPGEHTVFWADNNIAQGNNHCSFKLNADGEQIYIFAPDGVTELSSISFGAQISDISFARFPNSTGDWSYSANPTFGTINQEPEIERVLKINELMADNHSTIMDNFGDYEPWIEIFNPLPAPISLNGLFLSDMAGLPQNWPLPELNISANGYFLLWGDGEPEEGDHHTSYQLHSQSIGLLLSGPSGTIDEVSFSAQPSDIAYGRLPDGSLNWNIVSNPTPGSSNSAGSTTRELQINEFVASNDFGLQDETGSFEDWVEIYNPTDSSIQLNGLFLSDDLGTPMDWPFPDSILPAGEFLIIFCDNDPEDGPLHATFKLSANGEEIGLFDSNTMQFCDSHSFDQQTTDQSEGREWDGSDNWIKFLVPTPGQTNGNQTSSISNLPLGTTSIIGNIPNPFNPQTEIIFTLKNPSNVKLAIHDVRGLLVRELLTGQLGQGKHKVTWDGKDQIGHSLGSGTYFVRLQTNEESTTHRMMLLK